MRTANTRSALAQASETGHGDVERLPLPPPLPATQADAQAYLEAMPIALAIVGTEADGLVIRAQNHGFAEITRPVDAAHRDLLDSAVLAFIRGDSAARDVDWQDRADIGARHFRVRLSRLPDDERGRRCFVSFVERTIEVNTARSLRAEMLHDSLTGLPNRAAFIEAVSEGLAAARRGADETLAVLAVDLNRFSRINECMGSIAGDELIITVARRLL